MKPASTEPDVRRKRRKGGEIKVVKGKCQICGAEGEVRGFIKMTRNGIVRFEACMKCIERLT